MYHSTLGLRVITKMKKDRGFFLLVDLHTRLLDLHARLLTGRLRRVHRTLRGGGGGGRDLPRGSIGVRALRIVRLDLVVTSIGGDHKKVTWFWVP